MKNTRRRREDTKKIRNRQAVDIASMRTSTRKNRVEREKKRMTQADEPKGGSWSKKKSIADTIA